MNHRIYLSPPHMSGRELKRVQDAFATNWIAPAGPDLNAFEREFCDYTGAAHAAALSSGTAALHLALKVIGIQPGDEVLCSSFTFAGSAFPIVYEGASPVFVDSNIKTWNMDPQLLEETVKDRIAQGTKPKAVIVVHLYGQSAELDTVMEICKRYDLVLIEDAAESLGAYFQGRHTGTIAPLGIFSFNGNKIITTSGGGMLVGHDKTFIDKARYLATQARDAVPHYQHSSIGYNYRMSNIVAAIGRGQLTVLEQRVARKHAIFSWYQDVFQSISGISFMPDPGIGRPNRWLTCVTIEKKQCPFTAEELQLALESANIESRPLWKPMHLQPVFKKYPAYANGVSEKLFSTGLCLPSGTALSDDDLHRIESCIKTTAAAGQKWRTRR